MSIVADESLSNDVPVVRLVDDNTKETISITLVNDDTKEEECECIVDKHQTRIMEMVQELIDRNEIKTNEVCPQFTYNGKVIVPDDIFQPPDKFGMKDGDKGICYGLPSLILVNFIDECGELATIEAKSNDELWKVMKEYSAQKGMHSPMSQFLCFRWIYKGKKLSEIKSTLLQLGITSTDVIYFSLNPTKTDIDYGINNISKEMDTFVRLMDPDYFVGQSISSVHRGDSGRVRAADSSDQTWMIEFEISGVSRISVYKEGDLILGLQRFYENNGVLHDIREYLKNMIEKQVSDSLRLTEEVKYQFNDKTTMPSGATKKLLMTHLKLEQDIEETLTLLNKVKKQMQLEEDEPLDKMHDILTKQMINSTEVKKMLMATYKVNKPMLKVGGSVFALHSENECWEAGEITSFSEDRDVDGYGPRREYSILFDSGEELDDILDGEVVPYDDYNNRMRKDWKGVKHVCDKDSSDSWAQNIGWYTVNVFWVEEPFAYILDALRVYDAHTICCKKGDLNESDLNYPEEWGGFFTLTSQEEYTSYINTFVDSQWLSIRLMIAQERLADPILDPIFEVLHNCILPSDDSTMIDSWLSFETLKLDLGWRWKEALSDCMDMDDASISSKNSRFLEFALCLQSVEAETSIHQLCRFFIGAKGNLSDFFSRVPTFGAAYSISNSSDGIMTYLQANKPDNINNYMFIRCRDGNDMLRRVATCDVPFKHFLTIYAVDKGTSVKFLRVKYKNKMIFLSSIGKKTPEELGIKEDDILEISTIQSTPDEAANNEQPKQASPKCKKNTKKKKHKKSKKKRTQPLVIQKTDAELKVEHSKSLGKVHEEVEPTFKEIRQRLNALNLERTKPKDRTSPSKTTRPVEVVDNPLVDDSQLGGKAGKTQFIIQVGEVSNLYKTTKPSSPSRGRRQDDIMIDLHGLTAEEAVYRLDKHLPDWIETAMKGAYPFVIPVKIVCGGGSQILAELVENWIIQNDNVANAPKNMYS